MWVRVNVLWLSAATVIAVGWRRCICLSAVTRFLLLIICVVVLWMISLVLIFCFWLRVFMSVCVSGRKLVVVILIFSSATFAITNFWASRLKSLRRWCVFILVSSVLCCILWWIVFVLCLCKWIMLWVLLMCCMLLRNLFWNVIVLSSVRWANTVFRILISKKVILLLFIMVVLICCCIWSKVVFFIICLSVMILWICCFVLRCGVFVLSIWIKASFTVFLRMKSICIRIWWIVLIMMLFLVLCLIVFVFKWLLVIWWLCMVRVVKFVVFWILEISCVVFKSRAIISRRRARWRFIINLWSNFLWMNLLLWLWKLVRRLDWI